MAETSAKSFVVIMIVIAVCAVVLRILIDTLIKINIAQNESTASLTMKYIAAALENYASDKEGLFPTNFFALVKTSPAYLDKDYTADSPVKGYYYSCPRLHPAGYSCYASPVKCKLTGNTIYNITTGGLLISQDCSKKENE